MGNLFVAKSSKKKAAVPAKANSSKKGTNPSSPNTPTFYYLDTKVGKQDCAKDKAQIDKKCAPESAAENAAQQKSRGGILSKLKIKGITLSKTPWINDHCEFLMIKPSSPSAMFDQIKKMPGELANELGTGVLEAAKTQAVATLEDAIKDKLEKMAAKQLVGRGASFFGGPLVAGGVNLILTGVAANDAKNAFKSFPELVKQIDETKAKLESASKKVSELQGYIDKYKDPQKPSGYNEQALVSDMMHAAATTNACINARRCSLVPYNQTHKSSSQNGKGCCPGQSGHHVLPSSMFKGCKNYKEGAAPTICVEGTNNSHGSHGVIHEKLGAKLGELIYLDGKPIPPGAQISKKDAINAGTQSIAESFPLAGCDPRCIRAQLTAFYEKLNCAAKNESGENGGSQDEAGSDSTI
jgi:hypothetical protein